MAERPLLITIIAVLSILAGLIILLGGVTLAVITQELLNDLNIDLVLSEVHTLGYIAIAMGLAMVIVGTLFLTGKTIAWYLGLIVFAFEIVWAIYQIVVVGGSTAYSSVVTIVIFGVLIYYLMTPKVKAFYSV